MQATEESPLKLSDSSASTSTSASESIATSGSVSSSSSSKLSSTLTCSLPTVESLSFQPAKSEGDDEKYANLLCDISKNFHQFSIAKDDFYPSLLILDNNQEVNVFDFYYSSGSSMINQEALSDEALSQAQSEDAEQRSSLSLPRTNQSSAEINDSEAVSDALRAEIEQLVRSYSASKRMLNINSGSSDSASIQLLNMSSLHSTANSTSQFGGVNSDSLSNRTIYDEHFVYSLFSLILSASFKVNNFQRIFSELEQSHVLKNVFLALAKLGHECFKLNLLSTSEYLLEFALDQIDTSSLRLKMATLSTLSACYWRLKKFIESINCMHLELNLATYLNSLASTSSNETDHSELYNENKYRIHGNLASAHQRLSNTTECLSNFEQQLRLANEMCDAALIVSALNSIGLVYNRLREHSKSLLYFQKGLSVIEGGKKCPKANRSNLSKLKIKQLSLLGESNLKLSNYTEARLDFLKQLDMLNENADSNDDQSKSLNEAIALLNLGYIDFRLKAYAGSILFYDKCLLILLKLDASHSTSIGQEYIELFGSVYIGLVNSYLAGRDLENASLCAHNLLEYALKELMKLSQQRAASQKQTRSYNYLKFLEMTACFKLAICYAKNNRLSEAFKLHEREAQLAKKLGNGLFLARAYSNMAQIHYLNREYEESINLYKEILTMIESKLLVSSSSSAPSSASTTTLEKLKQQLMGNKEEHEQEENEDKMTASSIMSKIDERFVEIIYFTLSNIGLCMEKLEKFADAKIMYTEQVEISKLLGGNLKFKANSLLNLVSLYLNGKLTAIDNDEELTILYYLNALFHAYHELQDENGQLLLSQCLAYRYHTSGQFNQAIDHYLFNINMLRKMQGEGKDLSPSSSSSNENKGEKDLEKCLFNLSLCYKFLRNYDLAYKFQMEYYQICVKTSNEYNRMVSLGVIADILIESNSSEHIILKCIRINLDRLKLIKHLAVTSNEDVQGEPITKFVLDSLEKISKCYLKLDDYEQALRFKYLQLDLLNEQQTCDLKKTAKIWLDIGQVYLTKLGNSEEAGKYFDMVLKIALEINDSLVESLALGNLGLCKQKQSDYQSSLDYFTKQAELLQHKLVESNEDSLLTQTFREENAEEPMCLLVVEKAYLSYESSKTDNIKEIASIRIDLGRCYAKIAKSYEFLSGKNHRKSTSFYAEAARYYTKYCTTCKYLYEVYVKSYFFALQLLKEKEGQQQMSQSMDETETEEMMTDSNKASMVCSNSNSNSLYLYMNDLIEQIYIDYDTSLAKLSNFYLINNKLAKSINLAESRLSLLAFTAKFLIRNEIIFQILFIQIHFSLAQLYSNEKSFSLKSINHCESLIAFYIKNSLRKDIYYVKALSLYSDTSLDLILNADHESQNRAVADAALSTGVLLKRVFEFYKLVWDANKSDLFPAIPNSGMQVQEKSSETNNDAEKNKRNNTNNNNHNYNNNKIPSSQKIYFEYKLLELRFESTCKLYALYAKLNMKKECIQILLDSLAYLIREFQAYNEQNEEQALQAAAKFLLRYIDYLYQLNLKTALVYLRQPTPNSRNLFIQALKHLNEAFVYLSYQKEFESPSALNIELNKLRQANAYFLQGTCHKYLKNYEMELEMFANSLDLYESIEGLSTLTLKHNILLFSDDDPQFGRFDEKLDESDENSEITAYLNKRIRLLYQHIIDSLIRSEKHKEALLVTERSRTKTCSHLESLPDLVSFDQIEKYVFKETNVESIIYFNKSESPFIVDCWLLQKSFVKHKQVDLRKSFPLDKQFILDNTFNDWLSSLGIQKQENVLSKIYEALIKPLLDPERQVEENKSKSDEKSLLCIIYDQDMLQIPFHLLRVKDSCLFEVYEIDLAYSLKYLLFKNKAYNQKFTKYNANNESKQSIPMKIIANELQLAQLLNNPLQNKLSSYRFDLVLIFISSDNKDLNLLNSLINKLMSKRITKSVLIQYSDSGTVDGEPNQIFEDEDDCSKKLMTDFEANGKEFIKTLYSKMQNRTSLNATLVFRTLINESSLIRHQKMINNYLLFGNLGLNILIKNLLNAKRGELEEKAGNQYETSTPCTNTSARASTSNLPVETDKKETTLNAQLSSQSESSSLMSHVKNVPIMTDKTNKQVLHLSTKTPMSSQANQENKSTVNLAEIKCVSPRVKGINELNFYDKKTTSLPVKENLNKDQNNHSLAYTRMQDETDKTNSLAAQPQLQHEINSFLSNEPNMLIRDAEHITASVHPNQQITFGQITFELLKLSSDLDESLSVCIFKFVNSILTEFLFGSLMNRESIDFKSYFEIYCFNINVSENESNKLTCLLKSLFKSLGFSFFIVKETPYESLKLGLPDKSLITKLKLVQRCLLVLNEFSHAFLKSLYIMTKSNTSKQFLIYMSKCKINSIGDRNFLKIDKKIFKLYDSFFQEFSNEVESKEESKTELEIKQDKFNYLILIITILLNYEIRNDTESSLQIYIERFFKRVDNSDSSSHAITPKTTSIKKENEGSSQYSTLASLIGLHHPKRDNFPTIEAITPTAQSEKEAHMQDSIEIKIYRELSFLKAKSANNTEPSSKLTALNESKFLNNLFDNGIIEPNSKKEIKKTTNKNTIEPRVIPIVTKFQKQPQNQFDNSNELKNNNLKSSSIVKIEEKEFLDQVTTTTTTVTTLTSDSLLLPFDNNACDFPNHSTFDFSNSNFFNNSSDQFYLNTHRTYNGTYCNNNLMSSNSCQQPMNGHMANSICMRNIRITSNLNENIYSCLSNNYSDF